MSGIAYPIRSIKGLVFLSAALIFGPFYSAGVDNPLWTQAEQHADGWLKLPWYGWFNEVGHNWVYHTNQGYQYPIGQSTSGFYLYDFNISDWFWTSKTKYPLLYKFGTDPGWYWYYGDGVPGTSRFHRYADGLDLLEGDLSTKGPIAPGPIPGITDITTNSAVLTWKDNSNNETRFTIVKWNGRNRTDIAVLPPNTTSYKITGLSPGLNYSFSVIASNAADSAASFPRDFKTSTSSGAVAAPTGLTIENSNLWSVNLKWNDNSNNETAYHISYSTNGENGTYTELPALPAGTTSESLTQLTPCQTFWIKVRAVNGSDYSGYSNVVSYSTGTTAIITFNNSLISPFAASLGFPTYVGCWDMDSAQGSLGMYDDENNHIFEHESGSNDRIFPREIEQLGSLSSEWQMISGKRYDGNANLALLFRFSSYLSYFRDQYLIVYLNTSGGNVTPVSMWGGDMSHPIPTNLGDGDGLVLSGAISNNNLSIVYDQLPQTQLGVLQGYVSALIAFAAPALPGEVQVIYNADVYIEFNVPIYFD